MSEAVARSILVLRMSSVSGIQSAERCLQRCAVLTARHSKSCSRSHVRRPPIEPIEDGLGHGYAVNHLVDRNRKGRPALRRPANASRVRRVTSRLAACHTSASP